MKYLPVFQELFESDSIIFMLIGLVLALSIGIKLHDIKKIIISLVSSVVLYAVCELISNIHTNYCYWRNNWFLHTHNSCDDKKAINSGL